MNGKKGFIKIRKELNTNHVMALCARSLYQHPGTITLKALSKYHLPLTMVDGDHFFHLWFPYALIRIMNIYRIRLKDSPDL